MSFRDNIYNAGFFFEHYRRDNNLVSANSSFFEPYRNVADFRQQFRTVCIPPMIAVSSLCYMVTGLISQGYICAVNFISLDFDEFTKSIVKLLESLVCNISAVIVACAVTVAAVLSLFTRILGTALPLKELCSDMPDLRPDVPDHYKQFSL